MTFVVVSGAQRKAAAAIVRYAERLGRRVSPSVEAIARARVIRQGDPRPRFRWHAARARADAAEATLRDVEAEYDGTLSRQGDLLTRTANALRGTPPPLTSWSHHDVPERAQHAMDLLLAVKSYDDANQSDLPLGLLDSIRDVLARSQAPQA